MAYLLEQTPVQKSLCVQEVIQIISIFLKARNNTKCLNFP